MKKLLVVVLVLVVGVGALGYWQGWFSVTKGGKVDVQVDSAKFKQEKAAFSKKVGEQSKSLKDKVAGLLEKTEGLKGDDEAHAEKGLADPERQDLEVGGSILGP